MEDKDLSLRELLLENFKVAQCRLNEMMTKTKATVTKFWKKVIGWIAENPVDATVHAIATALVVTAILAPYFFKDWWGENGDGARNTIFALAGIGAFYGLWTKIKQLKLGNEQLKLGKRTQAEESVSRSFAQLYNKSISIRRVGVHLLHRIARENKEDSEIIQTILNEFVNDRSQRKGKGPLPPLPAKGEYADVEIALRALGEIIPGEDLDRITLQEFNFRNLDMKFINFNRSMLIDMNFEESDLQAMRISDSFLEDVNFKKANLRAVDFEKSYLMNVDFEGADLSVADLRESNLMQVDFTGAQLIGLKLQGARLSHAQMDGAHLGGAFFKKTDCTGIDFSKVKVILDTVPPSPPPEVSSPGASHLGPTLKQIQVDGMIYNVDRLPILPDGLALPKEGAYRYEADDNGKRRRRFVVSGDWLDPA